MRTPHFLVRSDAAEVEVIRLAEELERFRQVAARVTTTRLNSSARDLLRVDAYARRRAYLRAGGPRGTLGFYDVSESGPVAVMTLEHIGDWEATGIQVLYHEYTHHLMHRHSSIRHPTWYSEGFAEYMSATEFRDDAVAVGLPPPRWLLLLRNLNDWLSVRELMESRGRYITNPGSRMLLDPDRYRPDVIYQYAQGWLITHFFQHSPPFSEKLSTYVLALNQPGVDPAAAFEDTFEVSYREFERVIRNYWVEGALPYGTIELTELDELPAPEVRTLHPLEAAAIADETLARLGELTPAQRRRAVRRLSRVLEAGIRVAEMRELLGNLALDAGDVVAAQAQAQALLADDPASAAGATLRGRVLLQTSNAAAAGPPQVAEIRFWLDRALEADPGYVPALLDTARLGLLPDPPAPSESMDALQAVLRRYTGFFEAEELAVGLLARAGRRDEARERAQLLLDWSEDAAQQWRVKGLVEELGLQL